MAIPRSFPGYGWGWDPYQYAPGLNQMQLLSSGVGSGLTTPGFGSPSSASAFNPMSGFLSNQSASLSPLLQSLILQQQAATQPQPQAQGQPIVQHNPVTGFMVPGDALATVKNYITNVLGLNPQSFPQGTLEQAAQNIEQAVSTNTGPLATSLTAEPPPSAAPTGGTGLGALGTAAGLGMAGANFAQGNTTAGVGGLINTAPGALSVASEVAPSVVSPEFAAAAGPYLSAAALGFSLATHDTPGAITAAMAPMGPFAVIPAIEMAIGSMRNAAIDKGYQTAAQNAMNAFNVNPDVLNVGSNLSSLMAGNTGALGPLDAAIIQAQRAKTAVDQPEGSSGLPLQNWVASLFKPLQGTPAQSQLYSSLAGQIPGTGLRTPDVVMAGSTISPYEKVANFLGYAPGPPLPGTVVPPPLPPTLVRGPSPVVQPSPVFDPYTAYRPPPPPPPPPVMGGQNLSGTGVNMLAMAPSIQYHP